MTLPLKALRSNELAPLENDVVSDGVHEVIPVQFAEQGMLCKGFYKKLAGDYTEERAKYVVLTSILLRMALGKRAAEERLVYEEYLNDRGAKAYRIVGTLSYAIPDFRHMAYNNDPLPSDAAEQDKVAPAYASLLEKNIAAILLNSYYRENDDLHPGNLGLGDSQQEECFFAVIDYDRFLSQGAKRGADGYLWGTPRAEEVLDPRFFDNFPNDTKRCHMPSNVQSGTLKLNKKYPKDGEFRRLASSDLFHRQMMSAALQELLMHQPAVIERHLQAYLGEDDPFTATIMPVLQEKYDNFYRAVVFYDGCLQNAYKVPVPSFQEFLNKTPSAFQAVKQHVSAYNARMQKEYGLEAAEPFLITDTQLTAHYHQIWRDSHVNLIKDLISRLYSLMQELEPVVNPEGSESALTLTPVKDRERVSEASQLLEAFTYQQDQHGITGDRNNALMQAFAELDQWQKTLQAQLKRYIKQPRTSLTDEANSALYTVLVGLNATVNRISRGLGNGTSWQNSFTEIVRRLFALAEAMNWTRHLFSTDQAFSPLADPPETFYIPRSHESLDVVQTCLDALFDWVDTLHVPDFKQKLSAIVDAYEPILKSVNLLANRMRADDVRAYIAGSQDSIANQLAWILSQGEVNSNSLNTNIIRSLLPLMLEHKKNVLDANLIAARSALVEPSIHFNWEFYSKKAQELAKSSDRFRHARHEATFTAFARQCYAWAAQLSREDFQKILEKEVFQNYSTWTGTIFGRDRRSEIRALYKDTLAYPNERILAIILQGEQASNSLATLMFSYLWTHLRAKAAQASATAEKPQAKADWQCIVLLQSMDKTAFLLDCKRAAVAKAQEFENQLAVTRKEADSHALVNYFW
ncbi:MAG: hypothetical protein JJT82_02160 [Legionellaceae bacterium]|nr:hypothetical protein [Legionellaceae bacterium]